MLQLQILSGKQAGLLWEARRFPVRVGRGAQNDLRLEEDGVWDEHFQVALNPREGFELNVHSGALLTVNQSPVHNAHLRNGDVIGAGSVRISFRLSETRQRSLRVREWFIWMLVVGVSLSQIALIYALLQ